LAGSLRRAIYEDAMRATPGTAVKGSGVTTIRATPAFFIAELGEPGFESLFIWARIGDVSTPVATCALVSVSLERESAAVRTILFSTIARPMSTGARVNGWSQRRLPLR